MSVLDTSKAVPETARETIAFVVNGVEHSMELDPQTPVMDVLREKLDIISPKNGCQPMGQCGCCLVLVDGKPALSCVTPMKRAQGKEVLTLEGLPQEERDLIGKAFVQTGGLQCGFCIPGIAMRAKWLCDNKGDSLDREKIAQALGPHLCRCTGYTKIVDAVETINQHWKKDWAAGLPAPDLCGRVGTSLPRYNGEAIALGDKRFVDDIKLPGMLQGALLFSPHPRALVKKIDTSKALAMPGVRDVITAREVPGQRYVGLIYKDWPIFVAEGEETRCVGDILAAVAADDLATARRAVEAIEVEYEVRKPLSDVHEAMKPDAPLIHPENGKGKNLLSVSRIQRGDTEKAFAEAAHVVEESFRTQHIEHMFLEPESCIAFKKEGGRLHVLTQGQGVFDDRRQIADILGIPADTFDVELVSNGGAFGGKEDLSIQGQTALLAWRLGVPVKMTINREESLRLHPKRHPIEMRYKVACDAQGHLTAVQAVMYGDKGAYASVGTKVLERAGGHATGPYKIPNVDITAHAVYTNNPPCGAMRGFGANQAAFAIESLLNMLAEKVGIDGWDIRERNIMDKGDMFCTGQIIEKSIGLRKTLEAVKDAYKSAKYAGIACGIKNVGIGNGMPDAGEARLEIRWSDDPTLPKRELFFTPPPAVRESPTAGRNGAKTKAASGNGASENGASAGERYPVVVIYNGFTEMGQGLYTMCVQSLCEVLPGIDPRRVIVQVDTTRPVPCGMTTASRGTLLAGKAVENAALNMKADFDAAGGDLAQLMGKDYFGEVRYDYTVGLGKLVGKDGGAPRTHITYGFATQVVILNEKDGTIEKVIAAHDVGRVMNPILLEGQMEGSVHMGLGYALSEDFAVENSEIKVKKINDCGVIRAAGMPEIQCIFIEEHEPEGPFGAKGVGEIGLVPTAPAVAGALYQYDGKRRTKLPMLDNNASLKARGKKVG
jgi:selenium-dependent xanthine dehydrogenase